MANDLARAAAIQQTLNTPGYREVQNIGERLIGLIKNDALMGDEYVESKVYEARGAVKFYNKFLAAITHAANANIEAETEMGIIV